MTLDELIAALNRSSSISDVFEQKGTVTFNTNNGFHSDRVSAVIEDGMVVIFNEVNGLEMNVPANFCCRKNIGSWIANNCYLIG